MDAPKYKRLPGRGVRHTASQSTLWVGPDHFLSLDRTLGSETYRRFYFRDIEAIIIRRTAKGLTWNWIFLVLALICAGPILAVWAGKQEDSSLLIAAACAGGFWLLWLLVNVLRGPTCKTHVRTAVQIEELPSLSRLPTALKVLARVKPLIEEVQGTVGLEQIAAAPWSLPGSAASGNVFVSAPAYRSGSVKPIQHESGKIHAWLCGSFVASALLVGVQLVTSTAWVAYINAVVTLPCTILLIMALRRQSRSDLPAALKGTTWVMLGYCIVALFVVMAYAVSYPIRHNGIVPQDDPFFLLQEPGFQEVMAVAAIVSFVLGLSGLLSLAGRRRAGTPPPLVPSPVSPPPSPAPPPVPTPSVTPFPPFPDPGVAPKSPES